MVVYPTQADDIAAAWVHCSGCRIYQAFLIGPMVAALAVLSLSIIA